MRKRTAWLPLSAAFVALALIAVDRAHAQEAIDPANGKMLVASLTLQLASDEEVQSNTFLTSAAKEFLMPFSGRVRVQWKVKSGASSETASMTVGSSLEQCFSAKNQSNDTTSYRTGHCFVRVLAGDTVRVTVHGEFLSMSDGFMRDVRIFYDVKPGNGLGKVLP